MQLLLNCVGSSQWRQLVVVDCIMLYRCIDVHISPQTHTLPTSQTAERRAGRWASCPPQRTSALPSAPPPCSQRHLQSPWTPGWARPAAGRRPGRGTTAPPWKCPPGAAGKGGGRSVPSRQSAEAGSRWGRPGRTSSASPTGSGTGRREWGSRRWIGTHRAHCLPCSPGTGWCYPSGRWLPLCCCSSHRK